jgi:predicted nucleotidyltransferase
MQAPFRPAPLMRELVEAGVEFVVIGGLAVTVHGYERFTADLDLVPRADAENLRLLVDTLQRIAEPGEAAGRNAFDAAHLAIETRYGRVHVIRELKGLPPYAELAERAVRIEFAGEVRVAVCSKEDLIAMKRAAGRPRDALDVAYLTEASDEG